MYRETAVVNYERVAVLKSIKKSSRNIACIPVFCYQEIKIYNYASIRNVCYQQFNCSSIHLLSYVKRQMGMDLLLKQNVCKYMYS